MKTPIRYAGGKSKAYNIITEQIPKGLFDSSPERIISPFMGGGSLESRWSSELGIEVIGYDIFHALTNFWNVLLTDSNGLADRLSELVPTKEKYNEIKEILLRWDSTQSMLSEWKTDNYKRTSIKLDDMTAATYYFYNYNLSYGPQYLGWISSNDINNQNKWNKTIERIRGYKNSRLSVHEGNFDETILNHNEDFLYLDPPYYLKKDSEDNKMVKGLYPSSNFDVHHTGFDHELLRDLIHNHKGKFILSYNNCETIREYYKDFELSYPKWHISYAYNTDKGGDSERRSKESHEIVICKK